MGNESQPRKPDKNKAKNANIVCQKENKNPLPTTREEYPPLATNFSIKTLRLSAIQYKGPNDLMAK